MKLSLHKVNLNLKARIHQLNNKIKSNDEYTKRLQIALHDLRQAAKDQDRIIREIDVALNGDDAAEQASLVDILAQLKSNTNG